MAAMNVSWKQSSASFGPTAPTRNLYTRVRCSSRNDWNGGIEAGRWPRSARVLPLPSRAGRCGGSRASSPMWSAALPLLLVTSIDMENARERSDVKRRGSHGGPRVGPAMARPGKPTRRAQPLGPANRGVDLSLGQHAEERLAKRSRSKLAGHAAQVRALPPGNGLPGERPDHGAEFGLGAEAHAVIDHPDRSVLGTQTMAALAIGIVGHHVERRYRHELVQAEHSQSEEVLSGVR